MRLAGGVASPLCLGDEASTHYLAGAFPIMKRQRVCDETRIIAKELCRVSKRLRHLAGQGEDKDMIAEP